MVTPPADPDPHKHADKKTKIKEQKNKKNLVFCFDTHRERDTHTDIYV